MGKHIRKWFLEHSAWDIAKEIFKYFFAAALLSLWAALVNFSPGLLALIQLGLLVAVSFLAAAYLRKARQQQAQPEPQSQPFPLTLLDFYPLRDNTEKAYYKLKIRAVFRNDLPTSIVVTRLQWHAGGDEIQLQPKFAYRFQVEKTLGSWKNESWSETEELEIVLRPGWVFRFWMGVNPSYQEADIRQRHETRSVGTATLSVKEGDQSHELQIRL